MMTFEPDLGMTGRKGELKHRRLCTDERQRSADIVDFEFLSARFETTGFYTYAMRRTS